VHRNSGTGRAFSARSTPEFRNIPLTPASRAPDEPTDEPNGREASVRRLTTVTGVETVSQRELRNRFSEILGRVAEGESFIVTNNGVEAAVLAPYVSDVHGRLAAAGRRKVGRGLDVTALPARASATRRTDDVIDEDRGR
jgi:prevent-host-death family protein